MTITATAQGGRKSSDCGSGGGGESSVDTTVTTSLLPIVTSYHSILTDEVAEGRVNPQVSKHILGVSLFSFYVNDIFQILSGDFAA